MVASAAINWRERLALRLCPGILHDRKNWWAVVKVNHSLARLLAEHHAVGALDHVKVGDHCPICEKAALNSPGGFYITKDCALPIGVDPNLQSPPWEREGWKPEQGA